MEENFEVECKCYLNDKKKISKIIKKSEKIFDKTFVDRYYDKPDFTLLDNGVILRLRNFESVQIKFGEGGLRKEFSIALEEIPNNLEGINLTLSQIGLNTIDCPTFMDIVAKNDLMEVAALKKHRKSYKYGWIRVEIDEVEGLGNFVEFEILEQEEKKAKEAMKEIKKLVKELDLKPLGKNYLTLIKEKMGD